MKMKNNPSGKVLIGIFILIGLLIIGFLLSSKEKKDIEPQLNTKIESGTVISGSFDKTKMKSDEEWKKLLSPEEFYILREEGTEAPFTGKLLDNHENGTYYSVGCDVPLFRSENKYDSKTGWPSFWKPINEKNIVLKEDTLLGYTRTEVLDRCGNHLGHVFDDGPEPTGKRYCMNSIALRFVPDKTQ